jgi:hypothetical protein
MYLLCNYHHIFRLSIRRFFYGRVGMGFVQLPETDGWRDIECYLTEQDLEGKPVNEAKIGEQVSLVRKVANESLLA